MSNFEAYTNSFVFVKKDPSGFSLYDYVVLQNYDYILGEPNNSPSNSGIVIQIISSGSQQGIFIQTSGYLEWTGHGLTIGEKYYPSNTPGILGLTQEDANDRMILVPVSANHVLIGDDGG